MRGPCTSRLLVSAFAGVLLVSCAPAGRTAIAADSEEPRQEAAQPRVLRVGPSEELKRPSDAARAARNGDVVEIEAGTYAGDAAVWRQHRLTIRALGGRAHIRADGAEAEGKGIWVIKGNDATVEGIEFSGATVQDGNGAGIRFEGAGLTVRDCYFHDNQNGILTNHNPASEIVVERSEFSHNGAGDGQTHNMYIGRVGSFTLRFSYTHHAIVGHNVKSRAIKNTIAYNRIMDEIDGKSSYSIDLPNGGLSFVIGNLIQQGPASDNFIIVTYGAEGLLHPENKLYFVNNTVVNDRPGGGRFIVVKETASALIANNLFSGTAELLTGPGELRNNLVVPRSDFVDAAHYDYHLRAGSRAIGRGVALPSVHGFPLRPTDEYAHKAQGRPRRNSARIDLGALEYLPDAGR